MRERMERGKLSSEEVKDKTINNFNQATLKMSEDFLKKAMNGQKEIRDMADFQRLFAMFMQINELQNGVQGTGTLPELSLGSKQIIDEELNVSENEDGEGFIDEQALLQMTEEDVKSLLEKKDNEKNMINYRQI